MFTSISFKVSKPKGILSHLSLKNGLQSNIFNLFPSFYWAALPNSPTEKGTLHLIKGRLPRTQHQFHSANIDALPKPRKSNLFSSLKLSSYKQKLYFLN